MGKLRLKTLVLLCLVFRVLGLTDPSDSAILRDFRKGLSNPELLDWPETGDDPCGGPAPKWKHVFCSDDRVTQIQVQNLGLNGPLPSNFNRLTRLANLGFQRNNFTGPLPSFNGLSELQYAYLNFNEFDSIPADFFDGLTSLQVISLDNNPLNKSTGWMLPDALAASAQLVNLSCSNCNLLGPLPDFIGGFASLSLLRLSYNTLSGVVPASYRGLNIQSLILNNQEDGGLSGPIDFLPSMGSLVTVWLHGNSFTGPIPENITECASLKEIKLNNNKLTGVVPKSLANMTQLQSVTLDNNYFLGTIPDLAINNNNYTHSFNSFCQTKPGLPCSFQVEVLLDFLGGVNYPLDLAAAWKENNPCTDPWLGISCSSDKVSVINLQNHNLTGFISPSIAKLDGLVDIKLGGNNLHGTIPQNLTTLPSLKMLNLSSNNLKPPVPEFRTSVTVLVDQNPLINSPGRPSTSPPGTPPGAPSGGSSGSSPISGGTPQEGTPSSPSGSSKKVATAVGSSVAAAVVLSSLVVLLMCRHKNKSKASQLAPSSIVVHPRDSPDPDNLVKIAIANNANKSSAASSGYPSGSMSEKHLIESGDLVISVQVLRSVTHNFAPENELGRGGFGVVYKGQLHDGTMLAVKRMEASVVNNKALDEFHSEISVLSKVRHRNLVSLLGYSVEGNEKLLVYEYMPQGALSKHLFHWKRLKIEPLSWMRRLNIALDVAKGVEYLHNLAHQSFIHRDLKSSNILLGDDYRAKISDFGLVKLAPDGKNSVATRLAGTFGYLAPEYAVTGKITTKVDVFSFGVVLMELMTGLTALDEDRPEEARHLASWFYHIKSNKEKLKAAVDPALELTDETFEGFTIVAELAGHCTAREPHQRPDMGHAVNVLSPLVEKWKPMSDNRDECLGIDFHQPLLQMVKGWQADDSSYSSSINLDDSKGSIPSRPTGFAESFTSSDGR